MSDNNTNPEENQKWQNYLKVAVGGGLLVAMIIATKEQIIVITRDKVGICKSLLNVANSKTSKKLPLNMESIRVYGSLLGVATENLAKIASRQEVLLDSNTTRTKTIHTTLYSKCLVQNTTNVSALSVKRWLPNTT